MQSENAIGKEGKLLDNQELSYLGLEDPCRSTLPTVVKEKSPYRVVNGRIVSEACEINVTEHCNFTCRSCSHLSPVMPTYKIDLTELEKDLSLLAPHYHVEHLRLVGGEPLLHPQIVDVISIVQQSKIADRVRVITNGSVLSRMPEEFWESVDEVHVSLYPNKELSESCLDTCAELAKANAVSLVIKRFNQFRETYTELGTNDDALVKRIYRTCQIAHVWRCHTIAHGYFFRCPQSVFIPALLLPDAEKAVDGLKIHSGPTFGEELLDFLENPDPLRSCQFCLGSVGRKFDHSQVSRSGWRQRQKLSTEKLLDQQFLEQLEEDPDAHNGCFTTINEVQ